MNIFAIEGNKNQIDWTASALSLDNLRTVKMILETAQLLCTGLNTLGLQSPYKSFNPKHPSCMWVNESVGNFNALLAYGFALESEYFCRFGKRHNCISILNHCYNQYMRVLKDNSKYNHLETPLKMAMPEQFKNSNDIVGSYRNYFVTKPNVIYPENKIPDWFLKLRDPNLAFKIKSKDGKIKLY